MIKKLETSTEKASLNYFYKINNKKIKIALRMNLKPGINYY